MRKGRKAKERLESWIEKWNRALEVLGREYKEKDKVVLNGKLAVEREWDKDKERPFKGPGAHNITSQT
jgi:hypothetical protein